MKLINQSFVLQNGVKIPKIGLGTWQMSDGDETYNAVKTALKNGYRHIDTAADYRNETSVGKAVKDLGIKREEIFVTSKLPSHIKSYEGTLEAFEKTMAHLDFEYLDLYLIHAPWPWSEMGKDCRKGNVLAYKAMEALYHDGRIKAIGVSNFSPDDMENIITHCDIIPQVNQIGFFIGHTEEEILAYCKDKNVLVEAYSPLGIGYALDNTTIKKMADKYRVSAAQICIRYCLQRGTLPIPKSTHEGRIIENTQVDFDISESDMAVLNALKDDPRRWT